MLSLSVQLCPSAQGRIEYRGPSCHSLEVDCSDDKICVSAWTKDGKRLPCQFRISTPVGLFEPFSTSTSPSNCKKEVSESRLTTDDLDCSGVGNPTNESQGGNFHPPSVNGTYCPSFQCDREDTAELASRMSALTTDDSDLSSEISNPFGRPTPLAENGDGVGTITSRLSSLGMDDSYRSSDTDIGNLVGAPTSLKESKNGDRTNTSSLGTTETSLRSETGPSVKEPVIGLSYPLQLSRPFGVEADSTLPPTMRQFLMKDRLKPDSPLTVSCTSCDRTLSPDPVRFLRVEECCEGLSSELSEGWFCHAEAPPTVHDAQPLCLFFDSRCFYMHELTLRKLFGGSSACPSCESTLTSWGRPGQGFTPFFCDKIEFRGSDPVVPGEVPYRVQAVWVELWGMIRCSLETSPVCKLYLHSKGAGSEETHLLLSVFPSKEPFFLVRGSSEVRDHFRPEPFHRVRYLKCHQSASKDVKSWRHDFEVDFYRVSDFAATLLCTCLEVTTDTTHPSEDGFRNAYLPASLKGAKRFCLC